MHSAGDDLAQRHAVIAAGDRFLATAVEQRRDEFRARTLAVCAGDGRERRVGEVEGKFRLADERDSRASEFGGQRPFFVQTWAADGQVKVAGLHDEFARRLSGDGLEVFDLRFVALIKNGHRRAMQTRQLRGAEAAAAGAENGDVL